jgi:hypothetical protein
MIAPLVAFVQMFASADPADYCGDLRVIPERSFDLRAGVGSLAFEAAVPAKCRYVSFSRYALWDVNTLDYIQVYRDFPSFFSDATVTNHGRGLDLYSRGD